MSKDVVPESGLTESTWQLYDFQLEQKYSNDGDVTPECDEPQVEQDDEKLEQNALQEEQRLQEEERKKELDRVVQESSQSGYDEGYKVGLAEGKNTALKIESLLENVSKVVAEKEDELVDEATELAVTIARKLTISHYEYDRSSLRIIVSEGLRALPSNPGNLTIKVAQADVDTLHEILSSDTIVDDWNLVIDDDLSPGDCLIESATSQVDLTLESRINKLVGGERTSTSVEHSTE